MKKILFMLAIMFLIVFYGCSKDEPETYYTEKQEKAFAIFNGTWADIQFSNLSGGQLADLMPDPDKIVFGTHNNKPIGVYKDDYINGKGLLFDNQGECAYYSMPYKGAEYKIIECYYEISDNADQIRLYKRSDNSLFNSYYMSIKSETKINLQDPNLSLPFVFVKQ